MRARFQLLTQDLADISHAELAESACQGGVKWIQLRTKGKDFETWCQIAWEVQAICKRYDASLLINDSVEVAKTIGADGVHLGKEDMSPSEARQILGKEAIIGGTANRYEDVLSLIDEGVDYVGMGPFRFTRTKQNLAAVLGLEGYRAVVSRLKEADKYIPILAIGGVGLEDVGDLLSTGIHGVAVSSAVNLADDRMEAASSFVDCLNKFD